MPKYRILVSLLLSASFSIGAAAGCSKDSEEKAPAATGAPTTTTTTTTTTAPAAKDPAAAAKEIFATRCTPCHGAEGRGDGAASASLDPKPRDFHLADWQQSVTDEHIEKIIQYGGAAVGKSPAMPANPDLKDPAVIKAIAAIVRELGKQP